VTILITTNPVSQRLGQPIQERHRENEDRPRAFEELGKKLQLYMKFVDSYRQKVNSLEPLTYLHFLKRKIETS